MDLGEQALYCPVTCQVQRRDLEAKRLEQELRQQREDQGVYAVGLAEQ